MNTWHSVLEQSPMILASLVNGIEGNCMGWLEGIMMRLNMYKMVIQIQVVVGSVSVCGGEVCLNLLREMTEIRCNLSHSEREKTVVWLQV